MLVAGAATGALWAASDPLVGKWKVNSSKSKLTDEMKVEAVGANKYAVTFGPGSVDTIVADGTDQPALQGTTLSITVDGPNNWKVVRKRDGRTLVMGIWTLSADGKSLDDDFTAYQRDGSTTKLHYVYGRTAGSSGFTGTWDSMTAEVNSSMELEIQPYEGDSLSFKGTTVGLNYNVKFDGNDYPNQGPSADPGSSSSIQRVDEHNLEMTDKVGGKVMDTREIGLSPDGKTLTMAVHAPGRSQPDVLVFDRE